MRVALEMLDEEHNVIPNALYRTYMHFRTMFVAERRLARDTTDPETWREALTDARQLEAFVNDRWADAIRR